MWGSGPTVEGDMIRRRTTSTTRTSFLCWVASSMRRHAPECTSFASSCSGLALPSPKWLGSMWCSSSVCLRWFTSCSSPKKLSSRGLAAASRSSRPLWLILEASHHSYSKLAPSVSLSPSAKTLCRCTCDFSLWTLPWAAVASMFRRLISSWRRSLIPSLTLASRMSAPLDWSSSSPSPVCLSSPGACWVIHLWAMTCSEERRIFSSFSSIRLMKSSQTGLTRLGILTSFARMSRSSLNGKRPLTSPYMMTPIAHTSTFAP
mmetsp:Transcript_33664/g.76298  ORF Transcript_33664/g.76298 Transcript_33664/m.76298 type:complete len:261 (+) Transcript_33664:549-1331(+)